MVAQCFMARVVLAEGAATGITRAIQEAEEVRGDTQALAVMGGLITRNHSTVRQGMAAALAAALSAALAAEEVSAYKVKGPVGQAGLQRHRTLLAMVVQGVQMVATRLSQGLIPEHMAAAALAAAAALEPTAQSALSGQAATVNSHQHKPQIYKAHHGIRTTQRSWHRGHTDQYTR